METCEIEVDGPLEAIRELKPNLCAVVDGVVFGFKRYYPLPLADDYRREIDEAAPGWRAFSIYEGTIDFASTPPRFIGRPLCGAASGCCWRRG